MKVYVVLFMSPDINGDTFEQVFSSHEGAEKYIEEQHNSKAYRIVTKEVLNNENL